MWRLIGWIFGLLCVGFRSSGGRRDAGARERRRMYLAAWVSLNWILYSLDGLGTVRADIVIYFSVGNWMGTGLHGVRLAVEDKAMNWREIDFSNNC